MDLVVVYVVKHANDGSRQLRVLEIATLAHKSVPNPKIRENP
jgi:hypothetical protein